MFNNFDSVDLYLAAKVSCTVLIGNMVQVFNQYNSGDENMVAALTTFDHAGDSFRFGDRPSLEIDQADIDMACLIWECE